MRFYRNVAYAGVSLLSLASVPAFAQGAQPGEDSSLGEDGGEILVTARRRDESAQDVPLVVNAVTSESLGKLNIREFTDVQTVVPGLSLNPGPNVVQSKLSIRGVQNDSTVNGNNPSLQFYLNDAPVAASSLFTSMFDIGQIEVLRGPQGTLRGRSSPSGSITITTKRPDLNEVGGYVSMTGASRANINANGGVNVPLIPGKLAIRVAGIYEEGQPSTIRSLNSGVKPRFETVGERVSVRFDPIDTLSINASFTNVIRNIRNFDQVESLGVANPGAATTPTLITPDQRLSLESTPQTLRLHFKTFNWQADWRVAGQRLVYVGSHSQSQFDSFSPSDQGGLFTAFPAVRDAGQTTSTGQTEDSHELRLQSDDRVAGIFDYVIGGFIYKTDAPVGFTSPIVLALPAAAGGYQTVGTTAVTRSGTTTERSLFANLTAHLGEATELSVGGRYISYKDRSATAVNAGGFAFSLPNTSANEHAWVYNVSAKHRFSDSFMVYATVGSSWRPAPSTNQITDRNAAPSANEARFLGNLPPERSTSYEIGFKSDWMDRRLRLNVSAFHQTFENFYVQTAPYILSSQVPLAGGALGTTVSTTTLAAPVPVTVNGVEAELSFEPVHNLNLSASVAYALSKINNGTVPCNPYPTLPPVAANFPAGQSVSLCQVNYRAQTTPPFSATVQAEYNAPLSGATDGFLRGLVTYYGNSQGDPGNPVDQVKSYALTNLYAGIRDPKGNWEVSFFAKNLFNVDRVLSRTTGPTDVNGVVSSNTNPFGLNTVSNYRGITMTTPREFGLNVRYAFGSR